MSHKLTCLHVSWGSSLQVVLALLHVGVKNGFGASVSSEPASSEPKLALTSVLKQIPPGNPSIHHRSISHLILPHKLSLLFLWYLVADHPSRQLESRNIYKRFGHLAGKRFSLCSVPYCFTPFGLLPMLWKIFWRSTLYPCVIEGISSIRSSTGKGASYQLIEHLILYYFREVNVVQASSAVNHDGHYHAFLGVKKVILPPSRCLILVFVPTCSVTAASSSVSKDYVWHLGFPSIWFQNTLLVLCWYVVHISS